jgi:hypothetical protein
MELLNPHPYIVGYGVRFGIDGDERLMVAVRGTWDIASDGSLTICPPDEPAALVDRHHGDPANSSIAWEADLAPAKPGTDVLVVGEAVAPSGTRRWQVDLVAGPVRSTLHICGPRAWRSRLIGWAASEPEPFERCPLTWELAAGGTDATSDQPVSERRNPVGRGQRAKGSAVPREGQALPQITRTPDDLTTPVGWGATAPHWQPRCSYGGTYDDAWRHDRFPLLPRDFDPRFFQVAAPGLWTPAPLVGGEPVSVSGCHPLGTVATALPRLAVTAAVRFGRPEAVETMPLTLATVCILPTARRLRLLWRGEWPVHRRLERVRQIAIEVVPCT